RRWEHETVLEEMQVRLATPPQVMTCAKQTWSTLRTLKQWMGATHFLTRRLGGVSTEMSLNVLAYNLKRVMKIIGMPDLMRALAP
ncbi:IS5/IS1182 family transposase, partial [Pseudomonas syringae pv. actinidiae]|nr:IS5/IS1182 family transposase [Pseudomonas syringae pv. actinidiae]NVL61677.1 IS5/IS1182 family transposase [Pseudomonas syringae pv. actinidiae]